MKQRHAVELQESELRWRFAVDGSGDGLWDWNVPQSTVFFNLRWKEMLGFAENEIGNGLDEWSKRIHPDDLVQVMADVRAHLAGTTLRYVNEHRVSCKDDSWKWILDRGMLVERDAADHPLRMIGTHSDITERKRAEETVRSAFQYARSLVESILDPLVMISAEGKITDVNTAMENVTGVNRDNLIGSEFADYFTRHYPKPIDIIQSMIIMFY